MEALALMRNRGIRDVRSLVIGKGDTLSWHGLAARLGLTDVLTFTGPSNRVRKIFHAGDVLVHPTYYDPCSRVVLEGMTAGLPCVTTRLDGASEMIEDGKNGYVLEDPGDVTLLADRVLALRDDRLRTALGGAAQAVADRVSMGRHASEMLTLYEELRQCRVSVSAIGRSAGASV